MEIQVTDPVQQSTGINAYTSFKVTTSLSPPSSSSTPPPFNFSNATVIRRYSDFAWLCNVLGNDYPGAIIPPIPEKQATQRFALSFVEYRRGQLQSFLKKVSTHPEILKSEGLRIFLSADDMSFTLSKKFQSALPINTIQSSPIPEPPQSLKSTATSSLSGWFSDAKSLVSRIELVQTPDDSKFDDLTTYITTLEAQMNNVVRQTRVLVSKGKETSNGLFEFGLAFTLLGQSETDSLSLALTSMGNTADTLSVLSAEQSEKEQTSFEEPLLEYLRLITSVKAAIAKRVEKRLIYSQAIQDNNTKNHSLRKAQTQGRSDKIPVLQAALTTSVTNLETSKKDFEDCSKRLLRELMRFKAEKSKDMRVTVLSYINLQIDYNRRMEGVWKGLVPKLEGISAGGESGSSSFASASEGNLKDDGVE